MRQRQRKIIAMLSGRDGWVRGADLADELGVSLRTIQMDIRRINESKSALSIESNTRLGYRLLPDSRQSAAAICAFAPEASYGTGQNLFEGQIIMMLLFERDWLSADEIARRLFVSRSTVNAHLDAVRRIVPRSGGAVFMAETGKGLRIVAEERDCRLMCMKLLETNFEEQVFFGVGVFDGLRRDVEVLRGLLADIFSDQRYFYAAPAFSMLVNLIVISIMRSSFGFCLPDVDIPCENHHVREIVFAVKQAFGYQLSAAEECELELQLGSMSYMELGRADAPIAASGHCGQRYLSSFVRSVRDLTGVELRFEDAIARAFERHVNRMLIRFDSGMVYRGKDTARVLGEHPLAVHLLRTCLPLPLGVRLPASELEYLVPYVAHALEMCSPKLSLLLVTDESVGVMLDVKRVLDRCADEAAATVAIVPSYAFFRDEVAYGRAHHVVMTTDADVAFQREYIMFLGSVADRRMRDSVRRHILRARDDMDKQAVASLRRKFPVGDLSDALADVLNGGRGGCVDEALMIALVKQTDGDIKTVSVEVIGPSRLVIVAFGGATSCVQHRVCHPFVWGRKHIKDISLIRFAGDADMVSFFRYASAEVMRCGGDL